MQAPDNKYYIGIDPGISGAIVAANFATEEFHFHDMPVLKVSTGGKNKKMIDACTIAGILSKYTRDQEKGIGRPSVFIESVNAMPGQGVTSMFNFGMGYGIILGVLAALQMGGTRVSPVRWKRYVLKDMGKGKEASIVRAMELFPHVAGNLVVGNKKYDGRAEALLLSYYGEQVERHIYDAERPSDLSKELHSVHGEY